MEIDYEIPEKPLFVYVNIDKEIICKSKVRVPNIPETPRIGIVGEHDNYSNNLRRFHSYKRKGFTELTPEEFEERHRPAVIVTTNGQPYYTSTGATSSMWNFA
jgi:hypothetical protein